MGSWLSTAYHMDVLREKIPRKCLEPVRRETTEGSSIESIRYQMP